MINFTLPYCLDDWLSGIDDPELAVPTVISINVNSVWES